MVKENVIINIKGMIPFPCCEQEKIIVFAGTTGKSSIKCPRCQKYAVFDYDEMESRPGMVLRGMSHKLNNRRFTTEH